MKMLKYFNFLVVTTLLLSVFIPSIVVVAVTNTDNKENYFEGDNLKVLAEQVTDIPLEKDEIGIRYQVSNQSEDVLSTISIQQLNNDEIVFEKESLEIDSKKITNQDELDKLFNLVYSTEQKIQSTDLATYELKPNETRTIFIKAQVAPSFVGDVKQEVTILKDAAEVGELAVSLKSPIEPVSHEPMESTEPIVENPKGDLAEKSAEEAAVVTEEAVTTDSAIESPLPMPNLAKNTDLAKLAPIPGRGFDKPIYQAIHKGELYSTGNTNLKIANESTAAAQTFLNTKTASSGYAINNFQLTFADVDSDPNTYNSSKSYIDLDGGKEVAWAGLFWSASRYKGPATSINMTDDEITAPVVFKTPNGTSTSVTPDRYFRIDQQDGKDPGQGFGYNNTGFSNFADVTSIITGDGSATGSYTLGNIPMTNALNGQYQSYNFSGWSLFIVTKDQAKKSRAFSIYQGARGNKAGTNNEFTISDFVTAKSGALDPIVSWFSVQGDKYFTGDNAQIKNSSGVWTNITNGLNPVNNVMNGTVSDGGEHMVDKYPGGFNPGYPNFLDIDVDRMHLPEGLIQNGQQQIALRTTSSGDDFSTNAIGFSVNAEIPELEITKEVMNPKSIYRIGDEVTYQIKTKNTRLNSESKATIAEDILDSRLDFVPNSLAITSGPNTGTKTDQAGDDQGEYDPTTRKLTLRVGVNADAVTGGSYLGSTEETVYEFKAKINETALPSQEIPNSASVKGVDVATSAPLSANSEIVNVRIQDEVLGKLETTKTVNQQSPKIGDELEYQITFKNTIPNSVLKQVIVTDALPKGLTYVENSLSSEGDDPKPTSLTVVNGELTGIYPTIRDTKTRTIKFKVTVNQEAAVGTPIINKAKIDDGTNPPDEPEVPVTPIETLGALESTKSVNQQAPKIGDEIEYRITFKNKVPNSMLQKVTITDNLPKGLTYIENSVTSEGDDPKPTSLTVINGQLIAEYPTIRDNEIRTISFKVKVNNEAVAGTPIVNKATIDDGTNPPDEPEVPITPVEKLGELESTKSVNHQSPKVGDELEYSLTFKNKVENSILKKVVITDNLPKGLTYVENSVTSEGDAPKPTSIKVENGQLIAEYPQISDTKTRQIKFKVIVNQDAVVGTPIINKATIDDGTNPPDEPEVPVTPVETPGELEATKSVNHQSPKVGDELEYSITFRNKIVNGTLKKVSITDKLPQGLTYVENSVSSEGDAPQPTSLKVEKGQLTAEYPTINDTKTRTIRFKVIVNQDAVAGTPIINKAKIDDGTNPPDEPEVPVTPTDTPGALESSKSVNDQSPKIGDELDYRITFRNKVVGGKLKQVTITDTLPKGLTYVAGSVVSQGDDPKPTSLSVTNGVLVAEYPAISDNKVRTIIFKVKVNQEAIVGTPIVNQATIDDHENPPDEPVVPVIPVITPGSLESNKSVNNQAPKLGEEIDYRITFRNKIVGGTLNKVTITDKLPKGLTYVEQSVTTEGDDPKPDSIAIADGQIIVDYPTINDTKTRSIVLRVKVNQDAVVGTPIVNKVTVDDGINPPDEPEIPVIPEETLGELESTKSVNNQSPKVGDELEYQITFKNKIENGILKKVTITDNLPKGLTYVENSVMSEGDAPSPISLTVNNGKLVAEYPQISDTKIRAIKFKVTVDKEAVVGTPIVNKATIDDDTNPPDEPEIPVIPVVTPGELESTKSVNNQSPKVGDELEYRITFRNKIQNGVLKKVTITDNLPKGLSYIDGSVLSEGDDPKPTSLTLENGVLVAEYPQISDTKIRAIKFKVTVNKEAVVGTPIVNKATLDDDTNPPDEPEVPVTPVETLGELESTKSVNHQSPKVGDELEYSISFRNKIENSNLKKVTITDNLPKGLTYVENSVISEGDEPKPTSVTVENNQLVAEYPTIDDTKTRTIRFKVIVNKDAVAATPIINKATIDDHVNPPDEPEVPVTPTDTPGALESSKSVNNQTPKVGEELEYRINFRNKVVGGTVTKVTITDILPKGLTYVEGSAKSEGVDPKPTSLTVVNGKLVADYPPISDNETRIIVFKVKVNKDATVGTRIINKATIDDGTNPPDEPEIPVIPAEIPGELEATKSVNHQAPKIGDELEYSISFRNKITSSVLEKVTITDKLPKGLTYVERSVTSEGADPKPTSLTVKDGTLVAEYSAIRDTKARSIKFKVTVNQDAIAGTPIVNKATIDDHINPPEEPEIPVTPKEIVGVLESAKTVNNQSPKIGDEIDYTISFKNKIVGGTLKKVTVTDKLPKGLTYVEGSVSSEGADPKPTSLTVKDGVLIAEYSTIRDTKTRSIKFRVTVNQDAVAKTPIINQATIDDHINPPDEPEVPVIPVDPLIVPTIGNLETEKLVDKKTAKIGDVVTYRITVKNTIVNSTLKQVSISDTLPAEVTYVEGSLISKDAGNLSYQNGTISADFPELSDTKTHQIEFKAVINEKAKDKKAIKNIALVEAESKIPKNPEAIVIPEHKWYDTIFPKTGEKNNVIILALGIILCVNAIGIANYYSKRS
ncbi:isopeptide-forming domain-containing fimbrial protein [Carnobacterium gallinarum]|uniref:isopeptide-forming domain-containing fimbrial protein n=1 Tax=Carnobacterium gallinarum TaxID=2749 RepID=UPI000ACF9BA4|nr:isopeptide-forming domain-containing fimbrial protein [Carnobacterium gallinarum]